MAQDWTHEVMNDDLQVGDVIISFKNRAELLWQPWGEKNYQIVAINDGEFLSNFGSICTRKGSRFQYRVKRLETTAILPPAQSWNRKCPACGKGIYLGFASVEHEGGPCAARKG